MTRIARCSLAICAACWAYVEWCASDESATDRGQQ